MDVSLFGELLNDFELSSKCRQYAGFPLNLENPENESKPGNIMEFSKKFNKYHGKMT